MKVFCGRFTYIIELPRKKLKAYLEAAGWDSNFFNKEFSKAFVDKDGDLKNFAVDEKVERLTLEMA